MLPLATAQVTSFDTPAFVGALLADGDIAGTAFICSSPFLVVTCAHTLTADIKKLSWRRFDGSATELDQWRYLYFNEDLDIAIIASSVPLTESSMIADLPRHIVTRGIDVYFNGVSRYVGKSGYEYPFDSGSGRVVGDHMTVGGLRRAKMKSSDVAPGCSGAPVLYLSDVGIIIVGMISGRYNSPDWNRDSVWLVPAEDLRNAVVVAQAALNFSTFYFDLVDRLNADASTEIMRAQLQRLARDKFNMSQLGRIANLPFQVDADTEAFISGLRPYRVQPPDT